ncbi:MAG: hypothetical protein V1861_04630 [Candidatus Micrarchaeota archaeon]
MQDFIALVDASKDDSFAIRLDGKLIKLVLRNENGMCFFSKDGELKCAIEDAKPAICLSYPYSLRDGVPYIRDNVACPRENLTRADRTKMSVKTLEAMFWEAKRYGDSVRVWNRFANGNESLGDFLRFASNDLEADRFPLPSLKRGIGQFMLRIGLR